MVPNNIYVICVFSAKMCHQVWAAATLLLLSSHLIFLFSIKNEIYYHVENVFYARYTVFLQCNNIHFFYRDIILISRELSSRNFFQPLIIPSRTFHLVAQMCEQLPCRINCEFFADRHICVMFPVYVNMSNKSYPLMNSFLLLGCLPSGIEETEFCDQKPNIRQ